MPPWWKNFDVANFASSLRQRHDAVSVGNGNERAAQGNEHGQTARVSK